MKLLIAKDNPAGRKLLESTLNKAGHQTIVRKDGNEALNIFGANLERHADTRITHGLCEGCLDRHYPA